MKIKTNHVACMFWVAILCLLLASPVWPATTYVDVNNGTDDPAYGSGPGTEAWRTIEYAVTRLADNDVLNVAPGIYLATDIYPAAGPDGSAAAISQNGVTIQGAPGVIINGSLSSSWVSGFNITGANVVLRNLTITQFVNDGTPAIEVSGADARIESCTVSSSDYGIVFQPGAGSGNTVEGCTISENGQGVRILDSSSIIDRNTFFDNDYAIVLVATSGQVFTPWITNNLIYGTTRMQQGIAVSAYTTGSTIAGRVFHNTLYGGQYVGVAINQELPDTNDVLEIKYNIISGFPTGVWENYPLASIVELDYNDVYGNTTAYTGINSGPYDVSLDPMFMAPGSNFNFQAASPLIDLVPVNVGDPVTVDLLGGPRPTGSGLEMGCYEFGSTGGNNPPVPPVPASPADEAVFPEGTPVTLEASEFIDPDEDLHAETTWNLWRADSGENIFPYPQSFTVGADMTTHTISAVLEPGLKYEWQVAYKDSFGNSSLSEIYSIKVGDSIPETLETIRAGKSLGDFGMISIVHWPDNPDPQAVFNINYDPNNYRIGRWDPVQNRYIEFGQGLEMEPGHAYWILTREPLVINFNGIPVSTVHDLEVHLFTDPDTGQGWNMIAPPNKANYLWNQVLVGRLTDDEDPIIVDPVPVTSPVASTLINHRIWEWKDGKYIDHKLDEDFVLGYYKGYWVKAIVDGVYLVFPDYAQTSGLATPRTTMLAWKGKAIRWVKRLLPETREAIADNDSPPMPMGVFDNSVDPVFEGCFIESVGSGR